MRFLKEAYLDDTERLYDYGTEKVNNYNVDNFFDTSRTGFSYYDNFLNDKDLEYMQKSKGLTGHIEYISPKNYFKYCADFFNKNPIDLIQRIAEDEESLNDLREVVTKYKRRIMLPYLNFSNRQQEGMHRMFVAAEIFS